MRRDAWPDFHLMKIISIIHLTAGGLRRQSQQTVTHTVQSVSQTNDWEMTHNSKLALVLLPADQMLFGLFGLAEIDEEMTASTSGQERESRSVGRRLLRSEVGKTNLPEIPLITQEATPSLLLAHGDELHCTDDTQRTPGNIRQISCICLLTLSGLRGLRAATDLNIFKMSVSQTLRRLGVLVRQKETFTDPSRFCLCIYLRDSSPYNQKYIFSFLPVVLLNHLDFLKF